MIKYFDLMVDALDGFKRDLIKFIYGEYVESEYMEGVTFDNAWAIIYVLDECLKYCRWLYGDGSVKLIDFLNDTLENSYLCITAHEDIFDLDDLDDLEFALNKVIDIVEEYA